MGKRSNFERVERDFYPTPKEAVLPLLPHLPEDFTYWEPCAGTGDLVDHISQHYTYEPCVFASDIDPRRDDIFAADALSHGGHVTMTHIITNPPWSRPTLHAMIEHFSAIRPTWLLFDADWMHTKQSAPYLPWLRKVVSVGRVKWIPGSPHTGKDNCAWYLFNQHSTGETIFVGRAA